MIRDYVFIVSLERSGSTFLDLKIGSYDNFLSLGEVARTIKPHDPKGLESLNKHKCSCSKHINCCKFWKKKILNLENKNNLNNAYDIFFQELSLKYKIVDSSKFLKALKILKNKQINLKVIYLIRDVYGWTQSIKEARKRNNEQSLRHFFRSVKSKTFIPFLRYNFLRIFEIGIFLEWIIRNKKILKFLKTEKFNFISISYDLLQKEKSEFFKIKKFLNLKRKKKKMISHIVRGNRMSKNKKKYFYKEPEIKKLKFLNNYIKKINNELVYGK
mgnify:CR=1 FL=1|tara:strand:+ start:23927 stop:24742 length:816 start_codon:yes stop_codon:yes gene_type:complete